jgi:hypothetical protein
MATLPLLFALALLLIGVLPISGCPSLPNGINQPHLELYIELGSDPPPLAKEAWTGHCGAIFANLRLMLLKASLDVRFHNASRLTADERAQIRRENSASRPNRRMLISITGRRMPGYTSRNLLKNQARHDTPEMF